MWGVLGEAQLVRVCSQKRKPYTEMKTNMFCLIGTSFPWDTVGGGGGAGVTSTPAPAAGAPGTSSAAGGSWGLVLSAEWDRNLHLSCPPELSIAYDSGRWQTLDGLGAESGGLPWADCTSHRLL